MLILLCGNLLQIALWAGLFFAHGEFQEFTDAFYHSVVNFSTLGYGDLVMSDKYRLLGALEAVNGVVPPEYSIVLNFLTIFDNR